MTAQEALQQLHETGRAQGAVLRLSQVVREWAALGGKEPGLEREPAAEAVAEPVTAALPAGEPVSPPLALVADTTPPAAPTETHV